MACPVQRRKLPAQSICALVFGLLSGACEQLIGAEFGHFETLREAGSAIPRDGTSSSDAWDGRPPGILDGAGTGGDAPGSVDDGGSPPTDGSGTRCTPGEVHNISNCTNCGLYLQICNAEGIWNPPFCQEPPGACPPGSTEQRSCEGAGTQTATCTPSCTWTVDACVHSTCVREQIEKQPCGACGNQIRTCQAADGGWHWTPFSPCMDEKECVANQVDREVCGRCGTHARKCDMQCVWGSWEICQNEGDCVPGDTQERGCLIGLLKQTRTCNEMCVWGDWIGLCL
jgi:hypothetical protein